MSQRCFFGFTAIVWAAAICGCGQTDAQKLVGKWKGAPDVSDEISRIVQNDLDNNMPADVRADIPDEALQVTQNLAQATGKIAARMSMGMELKLSEGGAASFAGHTAAIGLKGDTKGTWEIVPKDSSQVFLRMGTKEHQVEGKIVWRDPDAFFFQYEAPYDAPTEMEGPPPVPEGEEPPKTKLVTMLFRRRTF